MIQSIGLFWRHDQIFWGAGSQAGTLLGVPANQTTAKPLDFRRQTGIYVLYQDYRPIYVGQAGSGNAKLFSRLKRHLSDDVVRVGLNCSVSGLVFSRFRKRNRRYT